MHSRLQTGTMKGITGPIIRTTLHGFAILLALAAPPGGVGAQGSAARGEPAQAPDTAALVVQKRTLVVFRAPFGARSVHDRAADAASRIEALLAAESEGPVETRPIAQGILVSVGGAGIFTITPADVDTLSGDNLPAAAARSAAVLSAVLSAGRSERSLAHLAASTALALLATAIFILILRLLRGIRRRLLDRLLAIAAGRITDVRVSGFTLFSADSAIAALQRLVSLVTWSAGLFTAYLWLAFVLTRFRFTRPWGEALGDYLRTSLTTVGLAVAGGVPGLFMVVVIVVLTRWVARMVGMFFDAVEGRSIDVPWLHPDTANPTKRIAIGLLWMFAIVLAYPYLPGSGSDVFKGVSVFAGVVISLGSSGVVSQAMSGLVLMYARALKPGDYVRVGDTEGTVTVLGMLSTKIRTTKGEEVTVPNAVVVGASVKNYSRVGNASSLFLYTTVTIGYDTPWRQVEALLLMAAGRTPGLRQEPQPFVLKPALSDFYVEYQLNAAIERPAERNRVMSALHGNILDCFNEYGVQITSPHYESDPARPAVVAPERWHEPPAEPRQS